MATVQELLKIGEQCGLEGDLLRDFIRDQQAIDRAEREKERAEREKEREEYKKQREEKEKEREEKEKDRVAQRQKDERDLKAKELEVELEKLRLSQELKKLEVQTKVSESKSHTSGELDVENEQEAEVLGVGGVSGQKTRGPKMTPFDERDDMDSYLHRFERYAELQGWKKEVWAVYLSALLKGRALDVYARLPPEQSRDYEVLKTALLKRYALTEEGYKSKFYDSKPEKGESPQQFIIRLESYFMRWLDLAKVKNTFEGVRALMIRERYLATCSKTLELFLRERAITDLQELGKLAEQFEDAHGAKAIVRQDKRYMSPVSSPSAPVDSSRMAVNSGTNSGQARPKCYVCGKVGHIAKNCFKRVTVGAMMPTTGASTMRQGSIYRNPMWGGNQNTGPNSQGRNEQQNKTVYCRSHRKPWCSECFEIEPADRHTCGAMLDSEVKLSCGCTVPLIAEACSLGKTHSSKMPIAEGKLFGQTVRVLRDTGCSTVVVKRSLVPDSCLTGETVICGLIDGSLRQNPVALIEVDTPYLKGQVKATCMTKPMYDLIVGNVPEAEDLSWSCKNIEEEKMSCVEVREQNDGDYTEYTDVIQAVTTRAQAKKEDKVKLLKVTQSIDNNLATDELIVMQQQDETLKGWWEKAAENETVGFDTRFEVKNGLLLRKKEEQNRQITQLAVPQPLREKVMKLAHDSIMSGHQGVKRTYRRVVSNFAWPGMHGDVKRYCQSCDICQRTIAKGRVPKASLGKMPLIDMPFKRVAVDLVGPIAPVTDRGNRYILTMVDYATRYPEATALKSIEAETVAEALITMFTRVGIPEEVLSDQGSQFMSGVMKEVSRLLSMSQLHTTVYHPMCNGLVERFNGTLKGMLRRMCSERPKDWDRYLPALLFAYREVPQESLGFSPFELLYGRTVRGPMSILKEVWTKQETDPDVKLTYQYVLELQDRLHETCELAKEELNKAQGRQKKYYDVKSKDRIFKPGEKVLLLLPTDDNKLLMHWKGPFEVVERRNDHNYRIQMNGRVKMFHANMLKRYVERERKEDTEEHEFGAVVIEDNQDVEVRHGTEYSGEQKETYKDVNVNPELSHEQKKEIEELLVEFGDIFTDVPKVTNLGEHSIEITSTDPVRTKAYPLPFALRDEVNREIDAMLRDKIIEPSSASYMSPIVVVKKSDGTNRICVDYRKLNKVTVFDPEPMPQMLEIFSGLSGSRYFSKFDFCKGYWQVPMKPDDKDLTTFVGPEGLYRFRVMPFGLVNAPATFSRIMRKLLYGLKNLRNYLDDVLGHTVSWFDHPSVLREFFCRVREANLALKPSKCFIGYTNLVFLGHKLGQGSLSPNDDLISKIKQAPSPTTKRQLRSFLGLIGYYRAFVPNFAAVAVPLSDLTKKGAPERLIWTDTRGG